MLITVTCACRSVAKLCGTLFDLALPLVALFQLLLADLLHLTHSLHLNILRSVSLAGEVIDMGPSQTKFMSLLLLECSFVTSRVVNDFRQAV